MDTKHYQTISPIGASVVSLLVPDNYIKDTCAKTIYALESEDFYWRFNLSTTLKYCWRLGQKGSLADLYEDIDKAIDYLKEEQKAVNIRLLTRDYGRVCVADICYAIFMLQIIKLEAEARYVDRRLDAPLLDSELVKWVNFIRPTANHDR